MIRLRFSDKIPSAFRNKYLLTILIFLVWLFFLDSNNLISRIGEIKNINRLKRDKEYYINRIEGDRTKLNELKSDAKNLEKFAREQYHMKKPDEDLYIVLTPKEDRKIQKKNR